MCEDSWWVQLLASPSFVDNVDHATPRALWRWTEMPRKGTTWSQRRLDSCFPRGGEYEGLLVRLPSPENNRMARPAMGVGWGGEACTAAQPIMGGGSRQSRRCWFERLEQEEQRLKKHGGRWMDIQ